MRDDVRLGDAAWVLDGPPVEPDCCGGTGYADYASVPCPNPQCPVPPQQQAGTWVSGTGHADALALIDDLLKCFVVYGSDPGWTAGVRLRRDRAEQFVARRAALGEP